MHTSQMSSTLFLNGVSDLSFCPSVRFLSVRDDRENETMHEMRCYTRYEQEERQTASGSRASPTDTHCQDASQKEELDARSLVAPVFHDTQRVT